MTRRILICCDYYAPGFKAGGPIRTLCNLVAQLGAEFQFSVATRNRDLGDPAPYPHIQANVPTPAGLAEARYLAPEHLTPLGFRRLLRGTPHDVLYLNSLFSPAFTIQPLLLRRLGQIPRKPVVLAPRGELAPTALRQKSAKKALFLRLAQGLGLYRGVLWQASSPHEAQDIRARFGPQAAIAVVPDLPQRLEASASSGFPAAAGTEKKPGSLRVVYLSRIAPIKNLETALQALQGVTGSIEFDIYGPIEDPAYWRKCQETLAALPANIRARHLGAVEPQAVPGALRGHDLFFLPTQGENFGHAILEALAGGLPGADQRPNPLAGPGAPRRGLGFAARGTPAVPAGAAGMRGAGRSHAAPALRTRPGLRARHPARRSSPGKKPRPLRDLDLPAGAHPHSDSHTETSP